MSIYFLMKYLTNIYRLKKRRAVMDKCLMNQAKDKRKSLIELVCIQKQTDWMRRVSLV